VNIPVHAPLHLLHKVLNGTLATHSREPAGFPYPTALPFAPTARHFPMILISQLAEHTRNLKADSRAGFLLSQSPTDSILDGQRLTLLGTFTLAPPDSFDELASRYLRYFPDAARYLELGDFTIWIMAVERMRYIGGFGAMGWIQGDALDRMDPLANDEEQALLALSAKALNRTEVEVLSIDRYGCDLRTLAGRNRFTFDNPKETFAQLEGALIDCIERHN
jgi:hypothetical protein